jgi:uncharacterized protein (UPF0332 family)
MKFTELEKAGLISKIPVDKKRVKQSLALAKRDLNTAKSIIRDNPDWAFSIAYNSMLQSARALMFSMGFRPSGKAQHISAIRFAEEALGSKVRKIITILDRMRRKRHRVVYDTSGLISTQEANRAVSNAEKFFKLVENELEKGKFI